MARNAYIDDYMDCLKETVSLTPVPGGVGPMTIACLISNILQCYKNNII